MEKKIQLEQYLLEVDLCAFCACDECEKVRETIEKLAHETKTVAHS